MKIPFVDLRAQYLAQRESIDARMDSVLRHAAFILGPEVEEAENALAEFSGAAHAISCASGTDALLMSLMALGIAPGDEVITTCFSWISTVEVIRLVGAKPVFVDIEPDTYNIDAREIEEAIGPKTRAIIPVSLFGQPADMDSINSLAEAHGLTVIEDAAQSFGASYRGTMSCNLSKLACTSFFPTKPLGCYGDGGAIFTSDASLAEKLRAIRVHGETEKHLHSIVGVNGRMDTLQCAVLLAKLEHFPRELERRRELAAYYDDSFAKCEGRLRTPFVKPDRVSAYAQYTLSVSDRDRFRMALEELGVPTAIYYPRPMHMQPAYAGADLRGLFRAEKASREVLSLPFYPNMGDDVRDCVVRAVLRAAEDLPDFEGLKTC